MIKNLPEHLKRIENLVELAKESDDSDAPVVAAIFLNTELDPFIYEVNSLYPKAAEKLQSIAENEREKYIQDNKIYIMAHAEENLISKFDFRMLDTMNAMGDFEGRDPLQYVSLYITKAPCCGCAEKIMNSLEGIVDHIVTTKPKEGTRWTSSQLRAIQQLKSKFNLTLLEQEVEEKFLRDAKKVREE